MEREGNKEHALDWAQEITQLGFGMIEKAAAMES
jgi:hypothetical protein